MENENQVQSNIPSIQPTLKTPITSSINWLRIILFTVLGLVVITGSVFVGIQIGKSQTNNQKSITNQPTYFPTQVIINPTIESSERNPTINPTADWKTYVNKEVGITFDYPSNWTLEEPTVEVLQVSLYPPESDPSLPSSSINFGLFNQSYLPEPTPYLCITQYESFFTNSNLQGRKSEDEPISVGSGKCLPKVGGCFPKAYIEFPLKDKTLEVSYCLADKNRFEEIIKTLKVIK